MASPLKDVDFQPRVYLNAEGALGNPRHEKLAIMLADGVQEPDAWRACGGESKESRRYGKRIYANATFQQRIKTLTDEKTELERDPIWGEATWQVNQIYRLAMATLDLPTLRESMKMRVQIATRQSELASGDQAAPAAPSRGPGAPVAESRNTRRLGVNEIKDALMSKNREAEAEEEPEDAEQIH